MHPTDPDPTYPPAFVWFARLIVAGLVVLFVSERSSVPGTISSVSAVGGAMTTKSAAHRSLRAAAAFILRVHRD
jgi:hypothetical protein